MLSCVDAWAEVLSCVDAWVGMVGCVDAWVGVVGMSVELCRCVGGSGGLF